MAEKLLKKYGDDPQGLKPDQNKIPYRSGEPLRHPKASVWRGMDGSEILPYTRLVHAPGNEQLGEFVTIAFPGSITSCKITAQ